MYANNGRAATMMGVSRCDAEEGGAIRPSHKIEPCLGLEIAIATELHISLNESAVSPRLPLRSPNPKLACAVHQAHQIQHAVVVAELA